jgi:hypothetical protein
MEQAMKTVYLVEAFALNERIISCALSADRQALDIKNATGWDAADTVERVIRVTVGGERRITGAQLSPDQLHLAIEVAPTGSPTMMFTRRTPTTLSCLAYSSDLDQFDVQEAVRVARQSAGCDADGAACGGWPVGGP